MKKIFMAIMALSLLAACDETTTVRPLETREEVAVEKKDVYELGAEAYDKATAKLKNVKNESEVELVETEIQNTLDALENSEAMAEYIACVNSGDSVGILKYEVSLKSLEEAVAAYSAALLDAYMQCGRQ